VPDRCRPVAQLDEPLAEPVEVDAEGTVPQPLCGRRHDEEVFKHRFLLRGDIAAGRTAPGLSRVRQQQLRRPASADYVERAPTRSNPAVGIMTLIPRAG